MITVSGDYGRIECVRILYTQIVEIIGILPVTVQNPTNFARWCVYIFNTAVL